MRIDRDLIWILGGRFITAITTLAAIRIATKYLEPTEYGSYFLLITFQSFCGLFLVSPIGQYINRSLHEWHEQKILLEQLKKYNRYITFCCLVGAASLICWSLFKGLNWSSFVPNAVLIALMVYATTWNTSLIGALNMLEHRRSAVFWASITAMLSLIASVAAMSISKTGQFWFIGQIFGYAVGALGSWITFKSFQTSEKTDEIKFISAIDLRSYVVPLAISTLFMWWIVSGYRMLVDHYWGLSALGLIAVGAALASQIWSLLESIVSQYFSPRFYRKLTQQSSDLRREAFVAYTKVLSLIYLALIGPFLCYSELIFQLAVSEKFYPAFYFFKLALLIELARVLNSAFANSIHLYKNSLNLLPPYAVTAFALALGLFFSSRIDLSEKSVLIVVLLSQLLLLTYFLLINAFIWKERTIKTLLCIGWIFTNYFFGSALLTKSTAGVIFFCISLIIHGLIALAIYKNIKTLVLTKL